MEVDTDADTTCHAVLPGDPHAPAGPSAATDGAIPAEAAGSRLAHRFHTNPQRSGLGATRFGNAS
jgi:hypothetical protein